MWGLKILYIQYNDFFKKEPTFNYFYVISSLENVLFISLLPNFISNRFRSWSQKYISKAATDISVNNTLSNLTTKGW